MDDKAAFPFGTLVGNEEKLAARLRGRPSSAPPRPSVRWKGTPRVPQTFDSLLRSGESTRLLGPKHNNFLEKVQRVVEQEEQKRKEDAQRASDGVAKRKVNEERYLRPNFRTRTRAKPKMFSEVPLLATSESAVNWYMKHSRLPPS
mmetsp:Transcript_70580/g.111629  ORF Transcript_70580/g.111629 Transcript_70580/m.111629 type:complete len:146 (+) Transcript_70580:73-510(+)